MTNQILELKTEKGISPCPAHIIEICRPKTTKITLNPTRQREAVHVFLTQIILLPAPDRDAGRGQGRALYQRITNQPGRLIRRNARPIMVRRRREVAIFRVTDLAQVRRPPVGRAMVRRPPVGRAMVRRREVAPVMAGQEAGRAIRRITNRVTMSMTKNRPKAIFKGRNARSAGRNLAGGSVSLPILRLC